MPAEPPGSPLQAVVGAGVLGLLSPGVLQRGHSHAERGTDGLLELRMVSLCYG